METHQVGYHRGQTEPASPPTAFQLWHFSAGEESFSFCSFSCFVTHNTSHHQLLPQSPLEATQAHNIVQWGDLQAHYLQVKTHYDCLIPVLEEAVSHHFPIASIPIAFMISKTSLASHSGPLFSSQKNPSLFHFSWYKHCHVTLITPDSLLQVFLCLTIHFWNKGTRTI